MVIVLVSRFDRGIRSKFRVVAVVPVKLGNSVFGQSKASAKEHVHPFWTCFSCNKIRGARFCKGLRGATKLDTFVFADEFVRLFTWPRPDNLMIHEQVTLTIRTSVANMLWHRSRVDDPIKFFLYQMPPVGHGGHVHWKRTFTVEHSCGLIYLASVLHACI